MSTVKPVWRADELEARFFRFGHPLDENAEASMVSLARLTGLTRAAVNIVRIAPGRRAFPLHRHHAEEEWTMVLSGKARVILDDETHDLGPGDFVAFQPGGPAHAVENPSADEMLVCLMGGENLPNEVVDFPEHGKRLTKFPGSAQIAPADTFEPFDFFSRTPLPMGTE